MNYLLRILPAADADIDAAALYIAKDNLQAALRFYDAVDRTLTELQRHPTRWPIYELPHGRLANVRRRAIRGHRNYLVFYRVEETSVEVIRVLHGARDLPAILSDS